MLSKILFLAAALAVWVPPLGGPLEVARPYEPPATAYAAGHRGIDLPAVAGDAVRAPISGTVTFAGKVVDRAVISVRVDEHTVYSLEPVAADLSVGDAVMAGELIGVAAEGGHCRSECVHLGVRVDDAYVNPRRFYSERPILLPLED